MTGTLGGTQFQNIAVVNSELPGLYVNASVTADPNANLIALTSQGATTTSIANSVSLYTESAISVTSGSTSSAITTSNVESLFVTVDVTAVSGTSPVLTLVVQVQDANGNWFTAATTPAITTTGIYALAIGPGLINNYPVTNNARFVISVGGTSPNFTVQRGILGK